MRRISQTSPQHVSVRILRCDIYQAALFLALMCISGKKLNNLRVVITRITPLTTPATPTTTLVPAIIAMNNLTVALNSAADCNEFELLFYEHDSVGYRKYMDSQTSGIFERTVRNGIDTAENWSFVCLDMIEHWSEQIANDTTRSYVDMQTLARLSGMDEFNDNDSMNASILRYIREHLTLNEIAERPTSQFLCRYLANAGDNRKDDVCNAYLLAQDRLERSAGADKQQLIVAMLTYLYRTGQDQQTFAKLCESATMNCNMYLSTAILAYDLMFDTFDNKRVAMFMFTPEIINDITCANLMVKIAYVLRGVFLEENEILDMPLFARYRCRQMICAHCRSFCNNAVCSAFDSKLTFCEHCPESYRPLRWSSDWSFTLDKPIVDTHGQRDYNDHFQLIKWMILARHSMLFITRVMLLSFGEHGASETDPETIERYRKLIYDYIRYTDVELAEFVHQIQLRAPLEANSDVCDRLYDMLTMSGGSAQVREYITAQQLLHENWLDLFIEGQADDGERQS